MHSAKQPAVGARWPRYALLALSILCVTWAVPVAAQQNPAVAKLGAKIEKIIINQVLKELKDTDYESYLILSAMWQGIKNQSGTSVDRSLQQLLVEKGFIYTLYSKGYRYAEPGLAYTMFSDDFFAWLGKQNPKYLDMVIERYDYMIEASALANRYFITDSFFNVRTLLNDVKAEVRGDSRDTQKTAAAMADYLLRTNYIPFKNRALLEDPAQRQTFVSEIKTYLEHNLSQKSLYKELESEGQHQKVSDEMRKQINRFAYADWIKRQNSEDELKEIYLEVISYTTRVMLSGDQEASFGTRAGRFPALRAMIQKSDASIKIGDSTLHSIRAALLARLRSLSRSNEKVRYASVAAMYTMTNTLIEQSRLAVRKYQARGSIFEVLNESSGTYFERYFVVPWYRDFYRDGWFGNEFKRQDEQYRNFYNTMQITALMTDYVVTRNEDKLVRDFQKYAWRLMLKAEGVDQFYKEKLQAAAETTKRSGITEAELRLIDATLNYILGESSQSELLLQTREYMSKVARIDRYAPEAVRKFEQHLEKSPLGNAPYFVAYYSKIARAISPGGDLASLDGELNRLNKHLIAEALSWRATGDFALYSARFDYELPVVGTTVRSILAIIEAQNHKSFRSTLLTTYNQSLDSSLQEMPEKTRAVSEPFIRSALGSVVSGQKVTSEEYTSIAMQSIRGVESRFYWLHFSLGFGVGYFYSEKTGQSASKVFINDMLGVDFIGLLHQINDSPKPPWYGLGIFAGGALDYMVSEAAKLDTRNLPGGDHYLKTGVFLNFRHPENAFVHFSLMGGVAFNLSGEPVYFMAISWNVFEVTDFF